MSVHLPVNQRRMTLSAVEQISSHYRFMAEGIASEKSTTRYCNVWTKDSAIKKIDWFAEYFKSMLEEQKFYHSLNHEEELRIAAKFDVICSEAISQLDDNNLRFNLFNKIAGIFKKLFDEILFENPSIILQPPFLLSEKDFQTAKMTNYQEYTDNKRLPVCYDFAFYQLYEEKSFPYIFNSALAQWPTDLFNDTINFLAEWGYDKVEEPSSGDLVVYSLKGISQHFGIWADEGNVISKLGINHVVKHPIDDVILGYGDDVSFFRKNKN